jgi:hypothetical protein
MIEKRTALFYWKWNFPYDKSRSNLFKFDAFREKYITLVLPIDGGGNLMVEIEFSFTTE